MGKDYRMKAESGGVLNAPRVVTPAPVFRSDVGSLREVLSRLPADMIVRVSVQGSDVGVCQLANVDVKDTELVIIGSRLPQAS